MFRAGSASLTRSCSWVSGIICLGESILAGLLVFRLVYFVIPLLGAGVLFGIAEAMTGIDLPVDGGYAITGPDRGTPAMSRLSE
jgi:hypothetical protein